MAMILNGKQWRGQDGNGSREKDGETGQGGGDRGVRVRQAGNV